MTDAPAAALANPAELAARLTAAQAQRAGIAALTTTCGAFGEVCFTPGGSSPAVIVQVNGPTPPEEKKFWK